MIIVPKIRCSRCLAIIDDRASGSACCSSRIAAVVVAFGDAHLGEPLQRVRLARRRPEVVVQVAGLGQLGRGELEIAGQERGLADQRRRERGRAQRAAAPRRRLQVAGDLDDLGVRRRPVEHELGRAEVAVEDRVGDLGVLPRAPQLEAHAVEPDAGAVGQQPLERDEVEHLPVALAREHQPLRLVARRLRAVEVGR